MTDGCVVYAKCTTGCMYVMRSVLGVKIVAVVYAVSQMCCLYGNSMGCKPCVPDMPGF